ncbi:MAG: hypothetical protein ABH863_01010 [Candidatus Micrarchaeota archaeon]
MVMKGKLIKVGNGAAITTTKKEIRQNKWRFGQIVEWVPLKKNKRKALEGMFGMYKGLPPFVRENDNREF